MSHHLALATLALAAPLVLVLSVWSPPGGDWLFAATVMLFPVALMLLGASRRGKAGPTAIPLVLLLAVLLAVTVGLFVYRGRVVDGPWRGGLPMAAAFQVYGLFLLPFLLSSLGYAATFGRWSLRQDELDRLRRRFGRGEDEPELPPEGDA